MAKPKLRKRKGPSKQSLKELPAGRDRTDGQPSRRKRCASEEGMTRSSDRKKGKTSNMTKTRSSQSHHNSTPAISPSTARDSGPPTRSKSSENVQISSKSSKKYQQSEKSSQQKETNCENTETLSKSMTAMQIIKSSNKEGMPLHSTTKSSQSTRSSRQFRTPSESTGAPHSTRTSLLLMKSCLQEETRSQSRNSHSLGAPESTSTSSHSVTPSQNARTPSLTRTSPKSRELSVQNGTRSPSRTSRSPESTVISCSTRPPQTARGSYQEETSSQSTRTHSKSRNHSARAPELKTPLRSTKRPRSVRALGPSKKTPRISSQSMESSSLKGIHSQATRIIESTKHPRSTRTSITPQSAPSEASEISSQNLGKQLQKSPTKTSPVKTFHNSYEDYVKHSSTEMNSENTPLSEKNVTNDLFKNKENGESCAKTLKSIPQRNKNSSMEIDATRSKPASKDASASREDHVSQGEVDPHVDCVGAEISAREITKVRHNNGRVSVQNAAVQVRMIGGEAMDSLQVCLDVKQNKRMICARDTDTYKSACSRVVSECSLAELIRTELERQKLVEIFQGHERLISGFLKGIVPIRRVHATANGSTRIDSTSDPASKLNHPHLPDLDHQTHPKQLLQNQQKERKAPEKPTFDSNTLDLLPDIATSSKRSIQCHGDSSSHNVQLQPHNLRKGKKSVSSETQAVCESSSSELLPDIVTLSEQTLSPSNQLQPRKLFKSCEVDLPDIAVSSQPKLSQGSGSHHTKVKTRNVRKGKVSVFDEIVVVSEVSTKDILPDIASVPKPTLSQRSDRTTYPSEKQCKGKKYVSTTTPGIAESSVTHPPLNSLVLDKSAPSANSSRRDSKSLNELPKISAPPERALLSKGSAQDQCQEVRPVVRNLRKRQHQFACPIPTDSSTLNLSLGIADSSKQIPEQPNQFKIVPNMSRKPSKGNRSVVRVSSTDSLPDIAAVTTDDGIRDDSFKDVESTSRKSYPLRRSKPVLKQDELPEIRPEKRIRLQSQSEAGSPVQEIQSGISKTPSTSKDSPCAIELTTTETFPNKGSEQHAEDTINKESKEHDKMSNKKTCKGLQSQRTRSSFKLTTASLNSQVSSIISSECETSKPVTTNQNVIDSDQKLYNTLENESIVALTDVKQTSRSRGKSVRRKGHCLGFESPACRHQAKQKGRSKKKSDFNVTKLSEQLDSQLSLTKSGMSPLLEAKTICPREPESPPCECVQSGSEEVDTATKDLGDPLSNDNAVKVPAPNTDDSMIDMMNNMLELSPVVPPCGDVDIYPEIDTSLGGEQCDEEEVLDQDLPLSSAQQDDKPFALDSSVLSVSIETNIDVVAENGTNAADAVRTYDEMTIERSYGMNVCDGHEDIDANEDDVIRYVGDIDGEWLVLDTVGDCDIRKDHDASLTKSNTCEVNEETAPHSEEMKTGPGNHVTKDVIANTIESENINRENNVNGGEWNDITESNVAVWPIKDDISADVETIAPEESVVELDEEKNSEAKRDCGRIEHKDEEMDSCQDINANSFEDEDGLDGSNSTKGSGMETEHMNFIVVETNVKPKDDVDNMDTSIARSNDMISETEDDQIAEDIEAAYEEKASTSKDSLNASNDIGLSKANHNKAYKSDHDTDVDSAKHIDVSETNFENITCNTNDDAGITSRDTDTGQVECDHTRKPEDNTDIHMSKDISPCISKCDETSTLDVGGTNVSEDVETDASNCEKTVSTAEANNDICSSKDIEIEIADINMSKDIETDVSGGDCESKASTTEANNDICSFKEIEIASINMSKDMETDVNGGDCESKASTTEANNDICSFKEIEIASINMSKDMETDVSGGDCESKASTTEANNDICSSKDIYIDIDNNSMSKKVETDARGDNCENKASTTKANIDICSSKDVEGEVQMKTKPSEGNSHKNDDSALPEDEVNCSLSNSRLCGKEDDDSGLCLLIEDSASIKQKGNPRLGLVDYSSSSDEEL